jgi:hypothetical protein
LQEAGVMRNETESERRFRDSLGKLAAGRRNAVIRGGVSILAASSIALLALIHVLYVLLGGWPPLPLVSFVLFWAGIAWALWYVSVRQVSALHGRGWLAAEVDRKRRLHGLVGAALEFSAGSERLDFYSDYLRRESVRRAERELRGLEAVELFPKLGRSRWTVAGILAGLILLLEIALAGGHERDILIAVTDPGLYFSQPRGFNLLVVSQDRTVLSGSSVICEAVNFGTAQGSVGLRISRVPGVWRRIELEPDTARSDGVPITIYRHRFADVRESFDYSFDAGMHRTVTRTVTVINRPVINGIGARITFPRYTGAPPETVRTIAGRIYAAAGSRLELFGETSKTVAGGHIYFSRAAAVPITPAPAGFVGAIDVVGDDTFMVEIIDTMGLTNEAPIQYPVVALSDMAPVVELLAPEDGAELPLSMEIELKYRASDDYGLSDVRLHFLREGKDETYSSMEIAVQHPSRDIEDAMTWELSQMRLFPGDELLYFLEAADNNTLTGPSRSRTEIRRLLVPSLSDMYARIREEEAKGGKSLMDVQEESRVVRERLRELTDEMRAKRNLDWSRRREAETLIDKHEELMEKIREAGERLDATLETLDKNRATSHEIGEKLAEIRDLLEQIESEELKRALEDFRKRLDGIDAGELTSAMSEIEVNMDELARRLDRAVELLKQVMREERVEELLRKMEALLTEQEEIRDSADDTEELSDRQRELAGRMGDFERDLSRFGREDTALQHVEETLAGVGEGELRRRMLKAAEELSGGDREGAGDTQGSVMDDMLALYTALARVQFAVQLKLDSMALRNITRAAHDLVEISKQEEEWLAELIASGGTVSAERTERQVVLQEAVRSIVNLLYVTARKTMAVSGTVFMHLDRVMSESDLVLRSMEQRRQTDVARHAERAYESLNLAAVELLRISAAMGGCSGQGSEGKMPTLTENQFSIDRQIREMLGGSTGGEWTMEERSRMARLAAEQRRLEEMLEDIVDEARTARRQLGRLDDLGEEMMEVARRLDEGELDSDVLEREERILSRMLESQRSLARRDYKSERTSRTAGDVAAADADRSARGTGEIETILESIRRGMREKGPVEYEQLIRLYFRALSRKVRSIER